MIELFASNGNFYPRFNDSRITGVTIPRQPPKLACKIVGSDGRFDRSFNFIDDLLQRLDPVSRNLIPRIPSAEGKKMTIKMNIMVT